MVPAMKIPASPLRRLRRLLALAVVAVVAVVAGPLPVGAADYPVAGLRPDRRPPGAPVIDGEKSIAESRKGALHGIADPLPDSLKFLSSQGAWYTPFTHPGMTGYYDIRGWHGDTRQARRN